MKKRGELWIYHATNVLWRGSDERFFLRIATLSLTGSMMVYFENLTRSSSCHLTLSTMTFAKVSLRFAN